MIKSLLNLHRQDVEKIRSNLLQMRFSKECDPSSNMMRKLDYRHLGKELGLGTLDRIVHLDQEKQVVFVEPCVPMDQLASTLLSEGYLVPVVPEFKGITVGGAISGAALESSSHRFGQFNDTCLSYEILLGNGDLVQASQEVCSDLFYGVAGSYGSLGIVTMVEIQLIPSKPWVHLQIHRLQTLKEAIDLKSCIPLRILLKA